jgi:hypothetical protein
MRTQKREKRTQKSAWSARVDHKIIYAADQSDRANTKTDYHLGCQQQTAMHSLWVLC